jgi:hypothetical protein
MGVLKALRRIATAVCLLAVASPVAAQETLEPDVKAAFLYNFTRYIEWPPGPAPTSEPFRLCVVADSVIKNAIQRTVTGESVNGRPLVMTEPRTEREAQTCQILFVGRSEHQRAARLLAAVRGLPVLTVGDSSRFTEQGGMIEFLLEERRVRFDVNLASAERSKLKLSANLLRVARQVRPR